MEFSETNLQSPEELLTLAIVELQYLSKERAELVYLYWNFPFSFESEGRNPRYKEIAKRCSQLTAEIELLTKGLKCSKSN